MSEKYSIKIMIWRGDKLGREILQASAHLRPLPPKNIKRILAVLEPKIFVQPRDKKGHFTNPTKEIEG